MDNWAWWVGLLGLLLLVFSSALAFALRNPSRARLMEQFEKRGPASSFDRFLARRQEYVLVVATLRCVCLVMVVVAVLCVPAVSAPSFGGVNIVVRSVVAWMVIMMFGVAIPIAWSKYAPGWLVVRSIPLLRTFRVICSPMFAVLNLLDPLLRRLSGVPERDATSYADELEQEILDVVSEGERHGAVDEEEKEMIESVIELADTNVVEIMTPRTEVVALPKESDLATILETIQNRGHSRIPIFQDTIDEIQGVLYAKDLLCRPQGEPFVLSKILRPPIFIPESKPVRELLRDFQKKKVHIAVVLDEYGGTAGLITIEDILEELVGEIADEYETDGPIDVKKLDDHNYEVDARMRIDELNDRLDLQLDEEGDFETIGGLVFSTLGRIPKAGERCEHGSVAIQVLSAEPRRITSLRLTIPSNERGAAVSSNDGDV